MIRSYKIVLHDSCQTFYAKGKSVIGILIHLDKIKKVNTDQPMTITIHPY